MRPKSTSIIRFILNEVESHPTSVVLRTAAEFSISRQAVLKRIKALIEQCDIVGEGATKSRKYVLATNLVYSAVIELQGLEEDVVWRTQVRPVLGDLPDNINRICAYGFTEILNNAIEHSQSQAAVVQISRTPSLVDFTISDAGVGIFRKIKDALNLEDERHALLELSKGKFTTDPDRHSGQGIFFTSRAFDHFSILSGNLFFLHKAFHDDWLVEDKSSPTEGTDVRLRISTLSPTQLKTVFDTYSTLEDPGFSKTHVPINLAQLGEDELVSRSQAKRLLARFDQFEEVLLDFNGIDSVGQAFADEVFRVFRLSNPTIKVLWINANDEVKSMIFRASGGVPSKRASNAGEAQ
jgi:anti-sigma regulatory factor (Ser/Thr protein kinase)